MKKSKGKMLIFLGVVNFLHGLMHILQFIQSILLLSFSFFHKDNWLERILENPIFALIMGLVGVFALITGIKDYQHHKKPDHQH